MLTDKSFDDSLNDSLQPSQLRSLEAEFETTQVNQCKNDEQNNSQIKLPQKKPQYSYRYTYSSEECSSEDENVQFNHSNTVSQSKKYNNNDEHFQTFGSSEQQFHSIQELISKQNYAEAYHQLINIQSNNANPLIMKQKFTFSYLLMQVYFGLQKYREMFALADQILSCENDCIDYVLDLLIEAAIKINNYQLALQYQIQLINRFQGCHQSQEQYRLGNIYLKLDLNNEAYFSFQSAYRQGNQLALEQLVNIGYTIDKEHFKGYAQKYVEQKNISNTKIRAKVLLLLAKEEYPNEISLNYQELAYEIIITNNGVKDKNTLQCLMNLAELKFEFNYIEQAEKDFELALQILAQIQGQANYEFLYCLGRLAHCQQKQKKYEESLQNLQRCFALSSQVQGLKKDFSERILFNLAYLKIITNSSFGDTLVLLQNINNSVLLNEIAIILQKYQWIDEAIQFYELAIKDSTKEQKVLINLNLAGCFGLKKDYQRSVELYKTCEIEVDDVLRCEIERKISKVYHNCNKFRESLFHLKRAYALSKQNDLQCQQEIKDEIKKF